jgi:hypothetical protein
MTDIHRLWRATDKQDWTHACKSMQVQIIVCHCLFSHCHDIFIFNLCIPPNPPSSPIFSPCLLGHITVTISKPAAAQQKAASRSKALRQSLHQDWLMGRYPQFPGSIVLVPPHHPLVVSTNVPTNRLEMDSCATRYCNQSFSLSIFSKSTAVCF